jgi:Tol biopolymer transport system component/DNA-binding winged helix-turn-helix (wHTH) protein
MPVNQKAAVFKFGDFEVREREFALLKAGEITSVEPKAFRVLLMLLRNPKKLIAKEELLNTIWGDAVVTENSLTRAVALLRKVLGDDAHQPRYIETVTSVGYRWLCPVEREEDVTVVSEDLALAAAAEAPSAGSATAPPTEMPSCTAGKSFWAWILATAAMVAISLVCAIWYLRRPLPPPRITGYTQITHDGRDKYLNGTDGNRLYFTQMSPRSIDQIGINGGEMAQIPSAVPGDKFALDDVSPDGSNGVVTSFDTNPWSLWVIPMLGGPARHVGDAERGAFSPDGESVIYTTMEGEVMVVRRDGTDPRKLSNAGAGAHFIRWSPDSRVLRFDKDDAIWEMAPDGSELHRLLPDWHEQGIPCCGRWTPDGHFYLFLMFSPNSAMAPSMSPAANQIWALDERRGLFRRPNSVPVQLTSGPLHWGWPIPSADGKKIFALGVTPRGELLRIDPKTGTPQPFLGGISAEFVSFSPDGRSIVYATFPEGDLWMANRDGSNRLRLSEPPQRVGTPQWSPDSKKIVYPAFAEGHVSDYIVSVDGGKPQRLLPEIGTDQGEANWSPDGTKILFDWGNEQTKDGETLRILDLSSRQVLTVPGSNGMYSSRWSPDGRYIAALDRKSHTVLHVLDVKEQRWSTLQLNADAAHPAFSHDSRFVYFLRWGAVQNVSRIRVTGGNVEQVADLKDWHLTGLWFVSMTLDPTDAPLLLRDVGSNDIYALTLEQN